MAENDSSRSQKYMFLKDSAEFAADLNARFKTWVGQPLFQQMRLQFMAAYQMYYGEQLGGLNAGYMGEQNEYSAININHARSLIKSIMALALQNRISFNCSPSNTDVASRNNAIVGESVLEQFFYEKRYEMICRRAFELGLFSGTAYIYAGWRPGVNARGVDENGEIVYAGEPELKVLSALDVLCESYKDDFNEQQWFAFRTQENRYDLVVKFPGLEKEIYDLPTIKDYMTDKDYDAPVWVYYAYHKPSPSLPQGRMFICCENNLVLLNDVNPYDRLPVVCYRPEIRFGSAFGHTPFFDLMPIQRELNILDSAELTIAENFAVPNIIASTVFGGEKGSAFSGGLYFLQGTADPNAPNGGFPQAMVMPKPDQVYANMREAKVRDMEMISGINATVRGQTQTNQSGTAIALVTSAAQQYNSIVEAGYIHLVEDLAMLLIIMCRKFMTGEEMVNIVGKDNTYAVKNYEASTFNEIQRVRINLGNPFAKTTAGRVEIGEKLLQFGMINPDDYLNLLKSGTIERKINPKVAKEQNIHLENEQMMQGQSPILSPLDNHIEHINAHHNLIDMPNIRTNDEILALVLSHIEEHVSVMTQLAVDNPMMLDIALGNPPRIPTPGPDSGVNPGEQAPQQAPVPKSDGNGGANSGGGGEADKEKLLAEAQTREENAGAKAEAAVVPSTKPV
jgi:hypothetical protein